MGTMLPASRVECSAMQQLRTTLLAAGLALASLAPLASADCPPAPSQPPSAAQMQQAQARARDRGLLWRISKDGRSAYLYGTIHVGTLDWAMPGPLLRAALQDSSMLALELDPTDPAIQQQLAAGISRTLTLDAALSQRLARRVAAACLPEGALASLHPLMQAVTLTLIEARRDGLDPAYAQELALAGMAQTRQWPVISLETVPQQLDALLPADEDEARRLIADTLDQLEQGKVRPMLKRLAEAWERGDLATLEQYERWCDCAETEADRAFLQRLIAGRNSGLAARIDSLHSQGRPLFAAVGALHMTGPQGLPALLAQRGYRVERLTAQP
jgi:uncharacterized protein